MPVQRAPSGRLRQGLAIRLLETLGPFPSGAGAGDASLTELGRPTIPTKLPGCRPDAITEANLWAGVSGGGVGGDGRRNGGGGGKELLGDCERWDGEV